MRFMVLHPIPHSWRICIQKMQNSKNHPSNPASVEVSERHDFGNAKTPVNLSEIDADARRQRSGPSAMVAAHRRQALEMPFFNGQTHAEIAQSTGEPLSTVKARIRRGLLKLRSIFQEDT